MEKYYLADNLNAINLYMYGVILKSRQKEDQAKEVLIKALNKYPLLWSAWMELNMILTKNDKPKLDQLPNHWIKNFMISSFYIKIQKEELSITVNTSISRRFPKSVYILNEIAHACYLSQNFEHALDIFG